MAAGDLPGGTDSALARDLTADLQAASSATIHEQRRLSERVAKIRRERYMWADMAMAGSVPADIAREKQQALAEQLTTAERLRSLGCPWPTTATRPPSMPCSTSSNTAAGPTHGDDAGRRDYNQAWFEALHLDADDDQGLPAVTRVQHTPLLASLQAHRASGLAEAVTQEQQRCRGEDLGGVDHVSVWNDELLVGSARLSCKVLIGSWLVRMVERRWWRSSMTSSRSAAWGGQRAQAQVVSYSASGNTPSTG